MSENKCKDCGAELKESKAGNLYCSKKCWLPPEKRKKPAAKSDDRYNPYETKIPLNEWWNLHSHLSKLWISAGIQAANSYVSDKQFAGTQDPGREIGPWTPADIKAMRARACSLFEGLFNNPPFIDNTAKPAGEKPKKAEQTSFLPNDFISTTEEHKELDTLPF